MKKLELGAQTYLFPMPVVLVGANVNDKPNYMTAAFCAIVNYKPVVFALGLGKKHFTNIGIKAIARAAIHHLQHATPGGDRSRSMDYSGVREYVSRAGER